MNKLAAQRSSSSSTGAHAPVEHRDILNTQRDMIAATEKISELYQTLSKFRKGLLKLEHDVDERDRALGPMESLGRIVKEELTAVKQERDRARRELATHKASIKFRALLHRTRERASYYERTNPAVLIAEDSTTINPVDRHPKAVDPMKARLASSSATGANSHLQNPISPALTTQPLNSAKNALRSYQVPSSVAKPNPATAADREEEEQQLTHCIANVDVIVATVVHVCIEQYEHLWQQNPLVMQEATRLFCRVVERVASQSTDRGRVIYRSGGDVPHSNFGGYHLLLFKSPKDAVVFASTLHYTLLLVPWPDELLLQDRPIFNSGPASGGLGSSGFESMSLLEKLLDEFEAKVQQAVNTPPDASFAYDTAIAVAQKISSGFAIPTTRVTNLLQKNALFRGLRAKVGIHTGVVFVEGSLKNAEPGSVNIEKNQYSFRPSNSRSSNNAATLGDSANPYSQEKLATDDVYGSFNARVPLLYGAAAMKASMLCGLAHGGETLLSQASHNATRGALDQLMMLVRPVPYLNTQSTSGSSVGPVVPVVGTVLYSLFEPQEVAVQVLPSRLHRRSLHFEAAGDAFTSTPMYNPTWWLPFNPFSANRMAIVKSQSALLDGNGGGPSEGESSGAPLPVVLENIALRRKIDDALKATSVVSHRAEKLLIRARAGMQRREAEESRLMQAHDQSAVEYVYGCVATRSRKLMTSQISSAGKNSPLNNVMSSMIADANDADPSSYAAQLVTTPFDGMESPTAWLGTCVEAALQSVAEDAARPELKALLHDAAFANDLPEDHWTSALIADVLVDAAASAASLWEKNRDSSGLLRIEAFGAANRLSGIAVQSQLVQFAIDLSACAVAFIRTRSALSSQGSGRVIQETIYGWNRFVCAVQNSDGTVGGTLAEHLLVSDEQWAQRRTGGGSASTKRCFASALITSISDLIRFAFAEHAVGGIIGGGAGSFVLKSPSRSLGTMQAAGGPPELTIGAYQSGGSKNLLSPRAVDDRDFEASRRVVASASLSDYRPLVISARLSLLPSQQPSSFLSWQHTQSSVPFSVLSMGLAESQFPYSTILVAGAQSEDLEDIRAAIKEAIGRVLLVGKEARQLSCYFLPCYGGVEQLTMASYAKHESTLAVLYPFLEQQQQSAASGSGLVALGTSSFSSLDSVIELTRESLLPKVNVAMLECWFLCVADAVNALHQCSSVSGFITPQSIFLPVKRPPVGSVGSVGPSAFLMEGAPLLLWRNLFGQVSGPEVSAGGTRGNDANQFIRTIEVLPPELLTVLANFSTASSDPSQCASRYIANWITTAVGGGEEVSFSAMEAADVWMLGMTMWHVATGGVSPFSSLRLQRKVARGATGGMLLDNVSTFATPDPAAVSAALLTLAPLLDIDAVRDELRRAAEDPEATPQGGQGNPSLSPIFSSNLFGSRGNLLRQLRLAMSSGESGGCGCFHVDDLWKVASARDKGAAPQAQAVLNLIETISLVLFCDLLHGMLKPIPEARLTMSQVLAHPFFSHVPTRVVDRMATEKVFPQYVGLGGAAGTVSPVEVEGLLDVAAVAVASASSNFLPTGMAETFVLDSSGNTSSSCRPAQQGQTFSSQVESSGPVFQVLCGDYAPQSASKRGLADDLAGVVSNDAGPSLALRSVLKDTCWVTKADAVRAVLSVDTFSTLSASDGSKSLRSELSPYMIDLLQL